MFKFLRKYNKWILAVGGTLLMITFLIPFAFNKMGAMTAQSSATWATVGADKKAITVTQLHELQQELAIIKVWQSYILQTARSRAELPPAAIEAFTDVMQLNIKLPEHWYLLVHEAEQAGLVGGPAESYQLLGPDADSIIPAIANNPYQQITTQPIVVQQTLAKVRGVSRLLDSYRSAGLASDRRVQQRMQQLFDMVSANLVVIEASSDPLDPAPTEEQISQQMLAYADKLPGEGPKGFGYKLPNRVKLEWLAIPADSVRQMLLSSNRMSNVELRKHWSQNKNNPLFGTPSGTAAIPEAVRKDLLDKLAKETLDEIAKFTNDQLRLNRQGITEREGYLVLPQGWTGLPFQELALRIQDQFKIALPTYQSSGEKWLWEKDVAALPGIGQATTDKFGRVNMSLPELVLNAKEFNGDATKPIQVGVAGPPLRGLDDSVYLFRILAADPSRAPNSVDEVRDAVVADLNRQANYEKLVESVPQLLQQAVDEGLLPLALSRNTAVQQVPQISLSDRLQMYLMQQRGLMPSPQPTSLPVIGQSKPTVQAIIEKAMSLPRDKLAADLPAADRTFVLPVDDRLSILVVEITDHQPVTRELLAGLVEQQNAEDLLVYDEVGDGGFLDAFSLATLTDRHKFALHRGNRSSDDEPTSADAKTKAGLGG